MTKIFLTIMNYFMGNYCPARLADGKRIFEKQRPKE